MKKVFLLAIVAMAAVSLSAQGFGVKAGANLTNYYGTEPNDLDSRLGFQVGGLYEIPLSGGLFLQPEAVVSLKGAQETQSGLTYTCSPFYLDIPVKLKYKLDLGAGKLTFAAGPYVGIGLFGKFSGGGESYNLFTKKEDAVMKPIDAGIAGAIGYELSNGMFINLESGTGLLNVFDGSDVKNSALSLVVGIKL